MSGENYVFGTIFRASEFVLRNIGPCLLRALPVIILAAVLHLPQLQDTLYITFLPELLEPFAYAMFAVAWHRYTLLPSERQRNGLIPRFGLRELKFGFLSLVITLAIIGTTEGLSLFLTDGPIIVIVIFLYIFATVSLMFVFPAIAVNQPVKIILFIHESLKLLASLITAVILASLALASMGYLFLYTVSNVLEVSQNPTLILFITNLLVDALVTPLILAIVISTVSYLFKDVIGLKEDKSTDTEETAAI